MLLIFLIYLKLIKGLCDCNNRTQARNSIQINIIFVWIYCLLCCKMNFKMKKKLDLKNYRMRWNSINEMNYEIDIKNWSDFGHHLILCIRKTFLLLKLTKSHKLEIKICSNVSVSIIIFIEISIRICIHLKHSVHHNRFETKRKEKKKKQWNEWSTKIIFNYNILAIQKRYIGHKNLYNSCV